MITYWESVGISSTHS